MPVGYALSVVSTPRDASEPYEAESVRREARLQWSQEPAGAVGAGAQPLGSAESFENVERYRYREQPWMHDTFGFERFAGAEVLEIGVGLGTDHVQFARAGATMTGIDLTPRCIELTRRRCRLEGVHSSLELMDAESLRFDDDAFDVVYSFGVLHHVASTERAFAEVRRVLRPGGLFLGGLYSRESIFWARLLAWRWLTLGFAREPIEAMLARIEYGAEDAVPRVRLFGREELRHLLFEAGFERVAINRRHLGLGRLTPHLPVAVERGLGRLGGWYLVHEAA
jgi:ubiquinone/menaquinone biosynthesis C-methylase UbiE